MRTKNGLILAITITNGYHMSKHKKNSIKKYYLYLNVVSGTDLVFILLNQNNILTKKIIPQGMRTEKFILSLITFLKSYNNLKLSGILITQGDGSFSKSRLMCTIANALAYGWNIPITIVKPDENVLKLLKTIPKHAWGKVAMAKYSGPGVG